MMKRLITILFILIAFSGYSQFEKTFSMVKIIDSLKLEKDAVDGYVLTSDIYGMGTWQEAASGGKWTDATTGIYFVDSVGIGKTEPTEALDVNGKIKADEYKFDDTKKINTSLSNITANQGTGDINIIQDEYDKIYAIRDGLNVWIRSKISETKHIAIKVVLSAGSNSIFNIYGSYLLDPTDANTVIAYAAGDPVMAGSDNVPPVLLANTGRSLGANHGFQAPRLFATAHGKDATDLLSIWSDGSSEFYLVEVIHADTLMFYPKWYMDGLDWKIDDVIDGNLTHVSGAAHTGTITFGSLTVPQMYPSVIDPQAKCYINGTQLMKDGFEGYVDFVSLKAAYAIIDPRTITLQSPFEWDDADSIMTCTYDYEFRDYASITMKMNWNIYDSVNIDRLDILQCNKITTTTYDEVYLYIPKSGVIDTYDVKAIADITSNPASQIASTSSNATSATSPPDRMVFFANDTGDPYTIGTALGNSTIYTNSDSTQKANDGVDFYQRLNTSGKAYINFASGIGTVPDTSFTAAGYWNVFDPEKDIRPSSFYWHKLGGYDIVYMDFHSTVGGVVEFPEYFHNRSFEVLENDGVTITGNYIPSIGLQVSTTTYGYAMLKITGTRYTWEKGGGEVLLSAINDNIQISDNAMVLDAANTGNIFIGKRAGLGRISSVNSGVNILIGTDVGQYYTGRFGVGLGSFNLRYGSGTGNTALGYQSQMNVSGSTGKFNSSIGYQSMKGGRRNDYNVALGYGSFNKLYDGDNNTGVGANSGLSLTDGTANTALGHKAMSSNIVGDSNVMIGAFSGYFETGSNKLHIDNTINEASLLYADFLEDSVVINGTLSVNNHIAGTFTNHYKVYSQPELDSLVVLGDITDFYSTTLFAATDVDGTGMVEIGIDRMYASRIGVLFATKFKLASNLPSTNYTYISSSDTRRTRFIENVVVEGNIISNGTIGGLEYTDSIDYLIHPPHIVLKYEDSVATVPLTSGVWTQATNPYDSIWQIVDGGSYFTISNDTIYITFAGDYVYSFNQGVDVGANNNCSIRIRTDDGVTSTMVGGSGIFGQYAGIPCDGYAELSAGEAIWVEIANITDNDDFDLISGNLVIWYLHP